MFTKIIRFALIVLGVGLPVLAVISTMVPAIIAHLFSPFILDVLTALTIATPFVGLGCLFLFKGENATWKWYAFFGQLAIIVAFFWTSYDATNQDSVASMGAYVLALIGGGAGMFVYGCWSDWRPRFDIMRSPSHVPK